MAGGVFGEVSEADRHCNHSEVIGRKIDGIGGEDRTGGNGRGFMSRKGHRDVGSGDNIGFTSFGEPGNMYRPKLEDAVGRVERFGVFV